MNTPDHDRMFRQRQNFSQILPKVRQDKKRPKCLLPFQLNSSKSQHNMSNQDKINAIRKYLMDIKKTVETKTNKYCRCRVEPEHRTLESNREAIRRQSRSFDNCVLSELHRRRKRVVTMEEETSPDKGDFAIQEQEMEPKRKDLVDKLKKYIEDKNGNQQWPSKHEEERGDGLSNLKIRRQKEIEIYQEKNALKCRKLKDAVLVINYAQPEDKGRKRALPEGLIKNKLREMAAKKGVLKFNLLSQQRVEKQDEQTTPEGQIAQPKPKTNKQKCEFKQWSIKQTQTDFYNPQLQP